MGAAGVEWARMATIYEPTDDIRELWREFVESRPEAVRAVACRFNPWTLYRMGSSGHRCTIHSFDEEAGGAVSMQVNVTGEYNFVMFDRIVFGVDPDTITECDLPSNEEPVGNLDMPIDMVKAIIGSDAGTRH